MEMALNADLHCCPDSLACGSGDDGDVLLMSLHRSADTLCNAFQSVKVGLEEEIVWVRHIGKYRGTWYLAGERSCVI